MLTTSGDVYLRGEKIGRARGITPFHIQDVVDEWAANKAAAVDLGSAP